MVGAPDKSYMPELVRWPSLLSKLAKAVYLGSINASDTWPLCSINGQIGPKKTFANLNGVSVELKNQQLK